MGKWIFCCQLKSNLGPALERCAGNVAPLEICIPRWHNLFLKRYTSIEIWRVFPIVFPPFVRGWWSKLEPRFVPVFLASRSAHVRGWQRFSSPPSNSNVVLENLPTDSSLSKIAPFDRPISPCPSLHLPFHFHFTKNGTAVAFSSHSTTCQNVQHKR